MTGPVTIARRAEQPGREIRANPEILDEGTSFALRSLVLSRNRAARYDLEAPVLYRTSGEHWSTGMTVNASSSGVLISGAPPVACAEPVTIVVVLPSSDGCLTACGRITRVSDMNDANENSTFAIAVPRFALERRSAAAERLRALHQGC